jgi:hypothetical protein
MPLLADRCQVALKIETVVGTAEALAAANVIMTTERPTWDPDVTITDRMVLSASPSNRGHVVGTKAARITFKMFQRGTTGAPTDPANLPDYIQPLRACGLDYAVSGGGPNEITTVTPASLGTLRTATVALYRDGKQYMIHGACGNVRKVYTVGAPVAYEFDFLGIYNTPTDVALLVPTYPTVIEPPFVSAALTIVGFATPKIRAISFDLGNRVALRPYPNTSTGFLSAVITGRDPSGTFDPEEELAGTKNWHSEFLAGTTGSLATGVFPSAGSNYNQISDTYPKIQYKKAGQADRDDQLTTPVDWRPLANTDAGNDELSWVQT